MSKCMLFDCDGTLVDSEMLNCEAMSAELGAAGIDEAPASLFERYKGGNFYHVLDDLQRRHGVALDEQFTERFRARAHRHFHQAFATGRRHTGSAGCAGAESLCGV